MGDEYDLVEEVVAGEVVVRRCDGWILDLHTSKKGVLVWRKEGRPEVRWVRMHPCESGRSPRAGGSASADGRMVSVSILFPRRSTKPRPPAAEQPPPSSHVQRILAGSSCSGAAAGGLLESAVVGQRPIDSFPHQNQVSLTSAPRPAWGHFLVSQVTPTSLFSCGTCRCTGAEEAPTAAAW